MKSRKEKIEEKELKMPYQFYQKYRLAIHKNVGYGIPIFYWGQIPPQNYSEWKNSIIEKYQNVTDIKFFINFKAYLNRKMQIIIQRKNLINNIQHYIAILIGFASVILTLIATIYQEKYIDIILDYLWIFFLFIVITLIIYTSLLNNDDKKLNFLNDYIKVIDEIISEKEKSLSTSNNSNSSSPEDKA